MIKKRTLEDVPGPVGSPLVFSDILLNSMNVSWASPQQPNGKVIGYVINYRTLSMIDDFRNDVQIRSPVNCLLVDNLVENVTYHVTVRAETNAGLGEETSANVTIGYNPGSFRFYRDIYFCVVFCIFKVILLLKVPPMHRIVRL